MYCGKNLCRSLRPGELEVIISKPWISRLGKERPLEPAKFPELKLLKLLVVLFVLLLVFEELLNKFADEPSSPAPWANEKFREAAAASAKRDSSI